MDFKYEMVVPNEDLPCKFFIFEGKNGNYRRANHWHQSVEIFLVLEGELKFYINNQSQPLSALCFRSLLPILHLIWVNRTMPYL